MSAAILAPRARREMLDAARWIAKDNPIAATAFRDAVGAAAQRIGARPQIGAGRPHLLAEPFRFWRVAGFPYVLVYNAERDPPEIVAIIHTARDLPPLLRDVG